MYKYFAWMCVYAPHECAVSEEARASDTLEPVLGAAVWILGPKTRPFARVTNALNDCESSFQPQYVPF